MTLIVVFDNNPFDSRLQTGWGFAAWLEYGKRTVLFDTGADGLALLSNLAALDLDPQDIDLVVLSHIHGDHTGGLADLLAINPRITVYVPQAFPASFKSRVRNAGATLVEVREALEISPGLWSTGQMGVGLVEQALVVQTAEGLLVVTGCAHPGVDRMVARAKEIGRDEIHLVVGGFHLGGSGRERIESIIAEFRRLGVQKVAPCHCTGDQAREMFRQEFGDGFYASGAGWHWQTRTAAWQPASQGIPAQVGVAAVAVAPSELQVVYLAAYEPGCLYRSTDGGTSWRAASGGLESLAPLCVAVHPSDPSVAWAGTMTGGYHTTDGGQHWRSMSDLPQTPIYTLAVTAGGRTLYAGGEATGIWHSDDGGQTWKAIESANRLGTILSLAIAPTGTILAGTAGQGVWASQDHGESWQAAGGELAEAHVPVLAAMEDGRLYALGSGHLYLSRDGGKTWGMVGLPDFDALSFAAEPGPGGRLYVGSEGAGLAVSTDCGESWALVGEELRHTDITCLVTDPLEPGRAYLGTLHNGLYRTTDGGERWTLISDEIGQPVVTALAQDPDEPNALYAGTLDGVYRSDDNGEHWQLASGAVGKVFVQGLAPGPASKRIYAGTRSGIYISEDRGASWYWAKGDTGNIAVFDIVLDPHDENRIYAGSWGHNILRSTDGGKTWAPIHHGLETLSVHALAVDPTDPQMLYAGTVEAVYRSSDGGETWQASPLADRPLTTFALVVDASEPAVVYAATTEGIYRSVDCGLVWQAVGHDGLDASVMALAPSPTDLGTLYAGTEHRGLFRSTDGGQHWQPWGLEGTSVYAILVDQAGTLWVGTDQGIYRRQP